MNSIDLPSERNWRLWTATKHSTPVVEVRRVERRGAKIAFTNNLLFFSPASLAAINSQALDDLTVMIANTTITTSSLLFIFLT
ncbi:hypothetical protein BU25DRAFT_413298 [Macroventuria anomochaeta]|uniref:Uncharacterized protein n=1 Tax=Macroventuria anomochaeta TaxID=301207 RepID=A0ACB6RSH8_9PLEO|nr:uncharacterized protein BU25DRAFT_413298 [Macroventuria anomochaeta]KAF2624753.1 hypothetical protein BU25DRAFT_413298 [Macroventuria anomochaeta]